ncbi:MAG: hypothetical protein WEE20_11365 [Bacteroidota bacterium]
MKIIEKLVGLFSKKHSDAVPLLIIKKGTDDADVKEFKSIEDAIADLENDPDVSAVKIEKLKSSIKKLKNKSVIKIKNGEIIK